MAVPFTKAVGFRATSQFAGSRGEAGRGRSVELGRANLLRRRFSSYAVWDLRRRSLLRANLLVLVSFAVAVKLSDFPRSRATLLLAIPAVLSIAGLVETIRCIQPRWNLYHGGVVLCIYMDLMAISMILFFLFSPYVL